MTRAGALPPLLLAAALALLPAALPAQVPDTVPARRDTVLVPIPPQQVVRDTLPPMDTARVRAVDTLAPPPHLPRFPRPERVGFAFERWEFDRAALQRYHGLSVLELLERVPGLTVTRAGGFGSPAGLAFAGQGGGRLRVFRDGFELDPLGAASLDLQHLGLLDLENLLVERTAAELRIHLRTFQLEDRRPFSEIEIGTGNFQARFLRALFTRLVGGRSVVTATYDLSSAGGFRFDEPFTFSAGRLRWDLGLGARSGLQLELRQSGATLESRVYPVDQARREVVLRGRTAPARGLTLEAVAGSSSLRPAGFDVDTLTGRPVNVPRGVDTLAVPADARQLAARALLERGFGFAEGGVRLRSADRNGFAGPRVELAGRVGAHPVPWLSAEAEARQAITDAGSAAEVRLSARARGVLGLWAFANLSLGERWLTLRRDTLLAAAPLPGAPQPGPARPAAREVRFQEVLADVGGLRAGVEWTGGRSRLGIAALALEEGAVVPFGSGFDSGMPQVLAGRATGVEASGALAAPGGLNALRLEGWFTRWTERGGRPYLPAQQGSLALVYHDLRRGGQFEPLLRLEAVHRGEAFVPDPARAGYVSSEPYSLLNFTMQLRILDVRAFFLYENLLREVEAADLPGRWLPGPRTLYGVRWFFRN